MGKRTRDMLNSEVEDEERPSKRVCSAREEGPTSITLRQPALEDTAPPNPYAQQNADRKQAFLEARARREK